MCTGGAGFVPTEGLDFFTDAAATGGGGDSLFKFGSGAQIGGELLKVFGAYSDSKAKQASYRYSADIARNNAFLAEYAARDAHRRGEETKADIQRKAGALKSSQIASLAARGLDLGEGSPLDILTSTDVMKETDVARAGANADREAWGHRVRATNFRSEADMLDSAGENTSPFMAAGGSLLTGATNVASTWYRYNRTQN
ncbi:MAG: hypothetical protein IT456_10580 [Planctomycetes bacterium]|nr:hypothetical protein [Planctomycetota bacterium]